jgi:hypothetical protein
MVEKHTGETHYLSLKEKGKRHARTKRLYLNRAFGGDCYHRIIDGDIDAGVETGERTGAAGSLSEQSQATGTGVDHVRRRERR